MNREMPAGIDPDAWDQFVITPGRYYSTMFFLRLPEVPGDPKLEKGGDMNALIWRKEESPNDWVLQWRFRYYRSPEVWLSGDEKVWFGGEAKGTEEHIVGRFEAMMEVMAAKAGYPVEKLVVQGDNEKFFRVVREQHPHWMHVGLADEQANKGGTAENN